MPEKRYACSIVSFSPNSHTSEFINVGVVVGNDEEGWRGRSAKSAKRARLIDDTGQLDNPNIEDHLLRYAEEVAAEQGLSEERLRRRVGSMGNAMSSFKLTELKTHLNYNLDAALDYCFETFVVEPID